MEATLGEIDEILAKMADENSEQVLEIARFAELGMSASAVIHELRQPLTALSMALQMTMETARGRDPEIEAGIRESLQLIAKAEMLLERARDFMRPSAGLTDLDVEECIARVLSVFEWQLAAKDNIRILCTVKGGPFHIRGDKAQIDQMLANLISNALDAVTDAPRGFVHVLARRPSDGGLEIIVADNGSGVDQETARHMFEPFYSTKGAGKGTGLGLFIVSKIASRHGAVCSFLSGRELASLGIPDVTTGFCVRFRSEESA